MNCRNLLGFALLICLVSTAGAQNEATLNELKKLHAAMTKSAVITADDGKKIADKLADWKLDPEKLTGEHKLRWLTLETLAPLAQADAAKALEKAQALRSACGNDESALWVVLRAASAAGDAQQADAVLKQLTELPGIDAEQKRSLPRRRSWAAAVGREAPEVTVNTDDAGEVKIRKRGDKVLLIDCWNMLPEPTKSYAESLKKLHDEFGQDDHVEFLGVNADAESRVTKAKEFAKKAGYVWPQKYEGVAAKAPVTHEALKAGSPPWLILVDSYGAIRAVGEASDTGFAYALRASLAEARGDFPAVVAKSREGKPVREKSKEAASDSDSKKPAPGAGDGNLKSDAEARSLLTQAHALRRGGMKTKAKEMYQRIVRDFPGTKEAKEAQEWLED